MKSAPPRSFAPILLALLPVLRNLVIVHPRDVGWGLVAVATLFVPTMLLQWGLIRSGLDRVKSALVAVSALIAFTHFGALHDALEAGLLHTRWRWMVHLWSTLILLLAVSAGWMVWLVRTQRRLWRLLQVLNLTALFLVIGGATMCAVRLSAIWRIKAAAEDGFPPTDGPRPDVFYVVLDAYTGAESLAKYWGYDNSPFLNQLRSRGFTVVTNAHSDYAVTQMCILSTFNMNLLPVGMDDSLHALRLGSNRLIRGSRVVRQFQEMGYEIVNLSPFDLDGNHRAYEFGPPRHGPYQAALKNTIWGRWRLAHWNRWIETIDLGQLNLDLLARLASFGPPAAGQRPKFVYTHIMMPHTPYVFDAEGRRRPNWNNGRDLTNHIAYLGQLIFASRVVQTNLDTLLAKYPSPPIVVVQGDHGFRWLNHAEVSQEATSILNALLLPENRGPRLPADLRPINTFRFLFNEYFGARYEFVTNHADRTQSASPPEQHRE